MRTVRRETIRGTFTLDKIEGEDVIYITFAPSEPGEEVITGVIAETDEMYEELHKLFSGQEPK